MRFLIVFFLSFNLFAAEVFEVPSFNLELKTENAFLKIEQAINNPENVLKRYVPTGGVVKNKIVDHNTVSFTMTKKVLFISKTFNVHFIVDIHEVKNTCEKMEIGYKYTVNLQGSDSLVVDNIDRLEFDICLKENKSNWLTAKIKGKIFKGSHYSEPVGSIAKNTIQDQVTPFVGAIKEEVLAAE